MEWCEDWPKEPDQSRVFAFFLMRAIGKNKNNQQWSNSLPTCNFKFFVQTGVKGVTGKNQDHGTWTRKKKIDKISKRKCEREQGPPKPGTRHPAQRSRR